MERRNSKGWGESGKEEAAEGKWNMGRREERGGKRGSGREKERRERRGKKKCRGDEPAALFEI